MNTSLEFALKYRDFGWKTFPVNGKIPLSSCAPNGFKSATDDESLLREWFTRHPRAGVAISTGSDSDLVVVDFDPKNGASPDDFRKKYANKLPGSPIVKTGGGGEHWYYRYPSTQVSCSSNKIGPGIDIRSNGGYVVAPPSPHASGKRYSWTDWVVPAILPDLFLELIEKSSQRKTQENTIRSSASGMDAYRRCRLYIEKLPASIQGSNGSGALWRAALVAVKGFSLTESEAMSILYEFNSRCTPEWSEKEILHKLRQAASSRSSDGYLL